MGLIKHGKVYWLDVRIGGKRIRRSLKTPYKNVALPRYGEVLESLQVKFGIESIKFSEFCQDYLEWSWNTKPASAYGEERKLKKMCDYFCLESKIVTLDDITPYHIEQLKGKLRNDGLSKSTINLYLRLLKTLFNRAIDWEKYSKPNPLKKVAFFRVQRHVEALSGRDVEKILKAAREVSADPKSKLQKLIYDLILFALNTGMRKAEVCSLTTKSVKDDTVVIRGKGDKTRVIPLNSTARAIIARQPRRGEYVFDIPGRNSNNLFFHVSQKIGRMAGIKWHFHQLRHFFVTRLLEKGVDFATISKLAGHSQLRTTFLYSHTNGEKMRKAVESLEG